MFNPQMTSSQMELLPLVCLCLLSWSGTTSADQHERVVVKQDDDVILPCSIGYNIEQKLFDWKKDGQTEVFLYDSGKVYGIDRTGQDEQFKGRVSHFKDELKHGNASIKITNTKMTDSGDYTCVFPSLQPPQRFNVKLVVEPVLKDRTGENIPGAAPKPYVKILEQTDDWALLQCEAHGVPDLEVHWQDSAGNKLTAEEPQVTNRGGHVYITLLTSVTKTDNFSCVATQKNISHRISADTLVRLSGAAPKPSVTILDQTETSALLQCEAHGVPDLEVEWKDSAGNILPAEKPQVSGRDQISITLLTTVTKTGRFHCVATQKNINHTISAEIYVYVHKARIVSYRLSPDSCNALFINPILPSGKAPERVKVECSRGFTFFTVNTSGFRS